MKRTAFFLLACSSAFQLFAGEPEIPSAADLAKINGYIENNAVSITSLVAGSSDNNDLTVLGDALSDKRIIGLGDATHGTHEFFVLKHRIIRHLIENEGCRAVALELPLDYGVHINQYVQTGEGDIDELLDEVWWWHEAREIRDFLVWLREYNQLQPDDRKVRFFGFDSQVRGDNTYRIFEYFKKVEDRFEEQIKPRYDYMAELYIDNYSAFTPFREQQWDRLVKSFKELLERNREEYIANSSPEEYHLARARMNTFGGLYEMKKYDRNYSQVRARTNAENIHILSQMMPADTKIVVWAHNGHIASAPYVRQEYFNFDTRSGFHAINTIGEDQLTGCMLRDRFGEQYYNIGFEFFSGGFTAIRFQVGIEEFTVDAPERHTLPYVLGAAETGGDCFFLPLERSLMDAAALHYFDSVQFVHEIGAAYLSRYVQKVPLESYNAILFVRTTTAAKLPR